jgi:hypothetical protein
MMVRQFLIGLSAVTLTIIAPIGMADRALAASTDLVFVVSAEAPIQTLSVDDIQNIYLGKKRLVGSFPISAVDHSETEPIKQAFLERVMHMPHSQYREQLMRRHFQEGAVTPKFVASANEALNVARETPGAIAYVYESDAGTLLGLKVLATVPAN